MTAGYSILVFCIMIASCSFLTAKDGYSQRLDPQKVLLSLHAENQPLERVFKDIEKQSDFRFFYNANNCNVRQRITVMGEKVSVARVLQYLSDATGLEFKQINHYFSVRSSRPDPSALHPIIEKKVALAEPPIPIYHLPANLSTDTLVRGKVSDEKGRALAGVTVQVKGTAKGTVTDAGGQYAISTGANAILVFSYIGYNKKEVPVHGSGSGHVTLSENTSGLNEVVVVGYGTQKKVDVTAAISSVDGDQIAKAPVASISNTLGGRVSGVLSRQGSGDPGNDGDKIRIRGIGTTGNADPLVVVDGIPMSYNQLNPNEIASVTILKDAAAVAPYGLAGANGVILVTTKRGQEGKFAFNYDGYYGFQRPTAIPEYLDAYGYAAALNQANKNVGTPAAYTDEQLQKFKSGSDPDHYPNTDWIRQVINFHAPITRHTLSFTGGTEKLRLYSDLGYLYQEGVVSPINFRRYNLTVNADADVTPTTTISLDINTAITKSKDPGGASGSGIFTDVTEIPPVFPIKFADGKPAHQMLPSIYESGYSDSTNNIFNGKLQITQDIPFIPGLSMKGVYAYHKNYMVGKNWDLPYTFYSLDAQDQLEPQQAGPPSPTLSQSFNEDQEITIQGYVTYKRSFGKHQVDFLGVYENRPGFANEFSASRINYAVYLDELSLGSSNKNDFANGGSSSRLAQIGWVYRLNYGYAGKYLVGLSGRYDGHYYFAPDKRFAFFPAVSLGWRLSEEHFIKDHYTWIDNLKLRGSYGKSGNLAGGPFQYLTSYGLQSSYVFGGTSPYQVQGIYENSQPNPGITWETAKKADIGLDADLWNGKLGFTLDVFKEKRSDMLLKPTATIPLEYGIGISQVNAGIMENSGFDFSATTNQHLGKDFYLSATFNFSYAKNKLVQTFETDATYNNPHRRRTGRALNTQFGLEASGLYQQSDFDADGHLKKDEPVPTYGPVQPGDIKYADLAGPLGANGKPTGPDGKIDINDYTVIGKPLFPQIIFGLSATLR
jgi:TonB-linked SusC/RagA family outer membrane protein